MFSKLGIFIFLQNKKATDWITLSNMYVEQKWDLLSNHQNKRKLYNYFSSVLQY